MAEDNFNALYMTKGGKVPASAWNRLLRLVKSSLIASVNGGSFHRDSSGTTLVFKAGHGSSTTATAHPWKPYTSSTGYFRLIPGTVDARLPSNWNAELAVQANQTGRWVYLTVSMSQTGQASGCTITQGAAVPDNDLPDDDGSLPGTFYVPLFSYDSGESSLTRVYQCEDENLHTEVTVTESCSELVRAAVIIA